MNLQSCKGTVGIDCDCTGITVTLSTEEGQNAECFLLKMAYL